MCIICAMRNPFSFELLPKGEREKVRAKTIKVELEYLDGKIPTMREDDPERLHCEELRASLREEQYSLSQKL